jgi:outer membrane protein TolC
MSELEKIGSDHLDDLCIGRRRLINRGRGHHSSRIGGRTVIANVMRITAAIAVAAVSATALAQSLSQREVINIALLANPALKAARARWEMMKERMPQARAWEDLRAAADFRVQRSVQVPPNSFMDETFMLEQEVPFSGKNMSRGRAATAEAFAAFEEFRRVRLDLVMKVRSAYARWANACAQLEVNRRNSDLLGQFVQISRSRYEAGSATQPDVLGAQTENARLLEMRADIERQISEAESALNLLMNRPPQAPLGRPEKFVMRERELASLQSLQTTALAQRPEIHKAQRRVEAEKARLQLANRQWLPDPAVNVKAQRYNSAAEGISEVDVGLSVPIPWTNYRKYSAAVNEARKSLETAEQELAAARAETLALVRDQVKKIRTAAEQYRFYDSQILPLARQSVEATRAGYEASTGGFLELATARRTLQDAESAALNRVAEYEIARAELDALIGSETSTAEGSKE